MELGVNAFYGVVILVVVFPVNYALTKISTRLEVFFKIIFCNEKF